MSTILRARQTAPVAAVALAVLTLGAGLATLPLGRLAHQPGSQGPVDWLFTVVVLVPGVVVGTLLAARRPRNPIGWILLTFYLLALNPASDYAIIDYRLHHGSLPLGSVAVVVLASWPCRYPDTGGPPVSAASNSNGYTPAPRSLWSR